MPLTKALLLIALYRDSLLADRDRLRRPFQRFVHDAAHAAAAGDFHAGDRDGFDGVSLEDLRQLGDVAFEVSVKLRAEDDDDLVPEEVGVEACVGEWDAICRDE